MEILSEFAKSGLIKPEQISEIMRIAEEKYGGSIDQALLDFNISEEKILEIKGQYFNIPTKVVNPKTFDPSILKYIPAESAQIYGIVPIGLTDGVLDVGIIDPENIQATDALQFIASKDNMPFKVYLISQ